jgi:hypothetical protein
VPVVGLEEHVAEELKLAEKTLKGSENLPESYAVVPGSVLDEPRAPRQVEPEALGGFKEFLDSLDFPVKPYGGLKRVLTPEEHVLWLCPKHAAEFAR